MTKLPYIVSTEVSPSWKLVHRLDKETSGALLLAKNELAEKAAREIFSSHQIEKLYLAIVDGKISSKEGVIDTKLTKKGAYQGQTLYGSSSVGVRAITCFRVLAKSKESSLLLCDLKTGRTHQIRVHLSEMGHPVLGDVQYAKKPFSCCYPTRRHLLHAWKLSFIHPFTHKKIKVVAPPSIDFKEALQSLFGKVFICEERNYASF